MLRNSVPERPAPFAPCARSWHHDCQNPAVNHDSALRCRRSAWPDCESARGSDADRHVKLLIQFAVQGSLSGAYSQARPERRRGHLGKRRCSSKRRSTASPPHEVCPRCSILLTFEQSTCGETGTSKRVTLRRGQKGDRAHSDESLGPSLILAPSPKMAVITWLS